MTTRTFRVLGPVEVWSDGRPVPRQTPRHRAVLAALLVDAGSTVPLDVLVERVWDGSPPTAQLGTLQAIVSKLRRELEPDVAGGAWQVLVTQAPGYRLAVDPETVDAVRFKALLRAARAHAERDETEQARAVVGEALELWRGPAYADVAEAFAVEEAARLEQLRLDARELAAELDLRLGRHAELVEELRELVRAEPLREGLRGSLMLALYRGGRQAEALQVYDEGRRLLVEELGVDPGRDLQALHERILRQDPELTAAEPARVPAPRPAPVPPPPDRLPRPLTAFVGRERELDDLGRALATQRLVTLVGPGGSGKTRLALEAARRRAAEVPAAFVELAGVAEPALVAPQIATALGVNLTTGDAVAAVVAALQGRPSLLVLDNCEHVVDAAAEIAAALLARCPDLRVLATSRQPLGLLGEAVVPCGPMAAGDADSDAARLFLDRARLAAPHLAAPSAEDLALVTTVCAELDGLPLAVELAAACLTTLPLAEVAARVDDRFALLSGGWRTAPPHQRTLAATVQWSVDLLDERQLAVFRAVSVFAGSFSADAVEAVAGPDGGGTLDALRALAAQSLVEVEHARGRYRMLETLRQYADSVLGDEERHLLRDRHAAFMADLAERLEPTLRRRDSALNWRRLDDEQPNLRAAMAHALAAGRGTVALRIAGSLGWWWYRRGYVAEGRQWLADALKAAPDAPVPVRMQALLGDALLAYLTGDVPSIWDRTNEIIAITPSEEEGILALALVLRGFVRALLGHVDKENETAKDVARGMAVAEVCGIDWVRSEIAMTLGQFSRADGNPQAALEHLDRAAELARGFGHTWAECSARWIRAKVLIELDRGPEALQAVAAATGLAMADGDRTSTLAGLLTAAGAATAAGDPRSAAVLLGTVDEQSRLVGYDPLRMDPVDGGRYVERTQAALDAAAFEAARDEGRALGLAGGLALLERLAGRPGARCCATCPPPEPGRATRPGAPGRRAGRGRPAGGGR
ncbi:BTAD domain-containing putative transcriptional regulator [Geodermatophilus sp. SYSU D00815]